MSKFQIGEEYCNDVSDISTNVTKVERLEKFEGYLKRIIHRHCGERLALPRKPRKPDSSFSNASMVGQEKESMLQDVLPCYNR